jgi:2-polyprenyl-3-methyl-5-hydroxy-6-metoxy-1,4-benzoquinol methylase
MSKKKDKRDELLALVPSDAKRILDVGCADGALGARLKSAGREVVGIDRDERSCSIASQRLSQTLSGDVEQLQLPFAKGYFDCIVYADVLEHLLDPLGLLKRHRDYLSSDGYVIASIPNIRYYKVIIRLLFGGTWDYVDKGILDRTHLRFFTLLNIKELFRDAGYRIVAIKKNIVAARGFEILNLFCFGCLDNLLTYQYYIKAKKSENAAVAAPKRKIGQF